MWMCSVIEIFCKTCTDVTSQSMQSIGVMSVTWLTLDPGDAGPPRPSLPVCNGRYQLIYELCQAGDPAQAPGGGTTGGCRDTYL